MLSLILSVQEFSRVWIRGFENCKTGQRGQELLYPASEGRFSHCQGLDGCERCDCRHEFVFHAKCWRVADVACRWMFSDGMRGFAKESKVHSGVLALFHSASRYFLANNVRGCRTGNARFFRWYFMMADTLERDDSFCRG